MTRPAVLLSVAVACLLLGAAFSAMAWEYAVLDGPTKRVLSRGRIDSCIECHRHYESTDFVTLAYLKAE
jgi:hypothetical protein